MILVDSHPHPHPTATRRPGALLRTLATLALALPLLAQARMLDDTPYATDPDFQGGAIAGDAYAANLTGPNRISTARRVVLGSNNEVIVASLVKQPGGAQSNGLWNLGLARYSQNGSRLAWGGVAPEYSHNGSQYVVFPNSASALYRSIHGMVRVENNLVVLMEVQTAGGPDLSLQVFGLDGSHKGGLNPFLIEYSEGGGLVTFPDNTGQNQVVVVGNMLTPTGAARSRPVFRRYQLSAGGNLSARTPRTQLAMPACANSDWECYVNAVASTTGLFTDSPRIYTAATYRGPQPGNEFAVVARFDGDGNRDLDYNPGLANFSLNDGSSGGIGYTRAVDLGLRERHFPSDDQIFLLTSISRPCRPGAALIKISHVGFSTATVRFGGSSATGEVCAVLNRTSDFPTALRVASTRVAAIGYSEIEPLLGGETAVDGSLAVFDNALSSGAMTLLDQRDFSYPIGGPREQYFVPWGLTAGAGPGRFTAVGSLRYPDRESVPANLRGKFYTAITRFREVGEAIFGNGFE